MSDASLNLYTNHPRTFHENRFVYPVVSRRSKGVSVGLNLNPDKVCNFDCIYCQVDRRSESESRFVETDQLLAELDQMLQVIVSGQLYQEPDFASVPQSLRRLNDLAFSGDGEPTTYRNFDAIVQAVADLKRKHGLDDTKLVLITNASMFHRTVVQHGLEILDANNGEVWAKLEAGTEEYFRQVDRTTIPFQRILDNILSASRIRPLVIQSLFMRINGEPPTELEVEAFLGRLRDIVSGGGQLRLVQIYTVARQPAESFVTPLTAAEVETIAERVRVEVGIPAESFPGSIN